MSIKRYLFILIGGIVVGVAAVQLLLIAFFKQHLSEEIIHKSQQLSTQIVDFAVEQIDLDSENVFVYRNTSEHKVRKDGPLVDNRHCMVTSSTTRVDETGKPTPNVTTSVGLKCNDNIELIEKLQSSNPTVKTVIRSNTITAEDIEKQKLIWKKRLHRIIEEKHQGKNKVSEFTFIAEAPIQVKQLNAANHFVHPDLSPPQTSSTAVDSLVDYMIALILASSALALFFALWLSNHFTRPLQQLSDGFQSLEKGEFGVQVEAVGINEYRKTIGSFNQMSLRLAQLAESEKMLQQQGHMAELGEVSRGLAHALRNPMHTIGLSVEQLKDPDLPDKLKSRLQDKIQAKIKHIDKTIKALLTLTSSGVQRNDEVPVRSVIQDVILEMKSNGPGVKISLDVPKHKVLLKGAESEIRAIIHTLIVNAVEASNGQGEVSIKLTEQTNNIVIEVTDQGKGIDAAIAEKLFEPHVSTKTEGAGMGLYISRRLATLYYEGSITLKDHQLGGCLATVTLAKGSQNE